jgi:hypothetical protein
MAIVSGSRLHAGKFSGHLVASLFSGKLSRLLLQVIFNDFLSTADGPDPAETRPGFRPLRIDADGPFPSGRISCLNDDVLDTSELHDRYLLFVADNSTPGRGFRSKNVSAFNELQGA